MYQKTVPGYTLIEMVVVLTILSIVSMMTLPSYRQWIQRFRYWEILQDVHPLKLQVEWCYWQKGDLDACGHEHPSIRALIRDRSPLIEEIEVDAGIIHIIPKEGKGFSAKDDLTCTPEIRKNRIIWRMDGGAIRAGYVHR